MIQEKKKILIIEDEANIRELVKFNLEASGYHVCESEEGIKGMTLVYREKPDLILLDIMLPGKNGFEIAKQLRKEGIEIPIIMLTAKADENDKVRGLEVGADDYLTKPFGISELLARVNAVLRRYGKVLENDKTKKRERIIIDNIEIIPGKYKVFLSGKEISLTAKEFELLVYLASNRGTVFTRDELLDQIWGFDYFGESRTVDVHIRNIRKKLKLKDIIETVRNRGYRFKEVQSGDN